MPLFPISFCSAFLFCLFINFFTCFWRAFVSSLEASCISSSIFLLLGFLVFSKMLWILTWKVEKNYAAFNADQNSESEQSKMKSKTSLIKSAPYAEHASICMATAILDKNPLDVIKLQLHIIKGFHNAVTVLSKRRHHSEAQCSKSFALPWF